MQKSEVRDKAADILQKLERKPWNSFLRELNSDLKSGRLDHNRIRKAVINCFKTNDKRAIILGSLLLQLENDEINELMGDKILN